MVLKNGETKAVIKDLPKYDKDGNLIRYTVKEDKVEGYTTVINGFNIINTANPKPVVVGNPPPTPKTPELIKPVVTNPGDKLLYTGESSNTLPVMAGILLLGIAALTVGKRKRTK